VLRAAPALEPHQHKFLIPTLHFQLGPAQVKKALAEAMQRIGVTRRASDRAVDAAYAAQRELPGQAARPPAAAPSIRWSDRRAGPGAGRPRLQHLRPRRQLRHPAQTAPSLRRQRDSARFPGDRPRIARPACTNMYWVSGRKILEAARMAAARPNLHLVYITNFKCGPDSYIKHFAREAAGAPLLVLQFDGHGNDAGYMTRCEAYLDSKGILRCYQPPKEPASRSAGGGHPLTGKRIYIPPMAWGSARAFAAAFRAVGLDAEPTPPSDHRTRELGARYTSGDECYPAKVTVGDFMKVLEGPNTDPRAWRSSCPPPKGPAASANTRPTCATFWMPTAIARSRFSRPPAGTPTTAWATLAKPFVRTGWRALLVRRPAAEAAADPGPYEERRGDTKRVYEESLADLCRTWNRRP
jgi:hypothetical protein